MTAPRGSVVLACFARCVELFRDRAAREEQKAGFRSFMDALQAEGFRLRDDAGSLAVNGSVADGPTAGTLPQRLGLHSILEISVPRSAPPAEVFELFRALSDPPGIEDVPTRLRAKGAHSIVVKLAAPPPRPPSPDPSAPRPGSLGTDGILRGEPMTDIKSSSQWVAGVPRLTYDPPPPPPETALPAESRRGKGAAAPPAAPTPAPQAPLASPPRATEPPAALKGPAAAAPPRSPAAPPPPPTPPPLPPSRSSPQAPASPSGRAGSAADQALQELALQPQSSEVGDVLARLGQESETALKGNRVEQFLSIVGGVVKQEQRVTDESARRHYSIALRRMLPKATLERLAPLVTVPTMREDALLALRRSGATGVEVLLDRLVEATNVADRRGAFDALRQMSEGTEQLIHLLNHSEWFVVRNMAELAGELAMEEAIPGLARQLGHSDERVRKATAMALAKIGTSGSVEALRRALHDKSPDVRIQVALGVGGRRSAALVMALVAALEEEKEETVQRELILALGRIGTPDAVQALIKRSQPGKRLFGRTPTALRVAAVEALRLAGTAPALGTLEGLAQDGDRQVSAAAKEALEELRKPPKR